MVVVEIVDDVRDHDFGVRDVHDGVGDNVSGRDFDVSMMLPRIPYRGRHFVFLPGAIMLRAWWCRTQPMP